MELKFEKTPCRFLRTLVRDVRNLEQTQELRLPDGMADIGRVFCAWGQVALRSKEWRGDGMGVSGGVTVWVLYAPEDDSGPQCVDVWIPFQTKWNLPETDREGVMCFAPLVRSVDARTVSARKLMIRVGIGIRAEAMIPDHFDVFASGEMPEGVEVLTRTYPVKIPKEAGEKSFQLDEELTLPGSCPAVEQVLRFEVLPQLADSRVMAGKVVFRGNGLLYILYRGIDGGLHSWQTEIPFSQFGELEEDLGQNAEARITMAVTGTELDRTEEGTLRFKCGLVAQYVIVDRTVLEIAEDAYSPHREVKPSFCDCEISAVLDERAEPLTAEIKQETECTKVVDVYFMPDYPSVSRMGDQVRTGQTGCFQLLYEDPAGKLQSALRRWEQDWCFEAAEDCDVGVGMTRNGLPTAVCNGGSAEVKGNVTLTACTATTRCPNMMCGMELGEAIKPDHNRPSVILRRTEGERLWDLAKRCGTTVQAICQANGLSGEPEPGRMLLIPVM